jgi:zinc/manganese transport system permease protein
MFSGLMANAWEVATIVAVVAGVVGFFVVMRGSSFVAHAVPNSAFAGAAGASLLGVNTIFGLGVFALASALGIGWLGKRGRHDVVTALAVVVMLGLGSLFLSWSSEYASEIYSLLFGEVLGVSPNEIGLTALLAVVAIGAVAVLYRPLILTSVAPDIAEARGVRTHRTEMLFLVIVALAATMSVPVVGALLMFSLMVGPPAAARCFSNRPVVVIPLSVGFALLTVWSAVALSYETDWPIGFFVGTLGMAAYIVGRLWAGWRRTRVARTPVRTAAVGTISAGT